jgi:serine/threonine-protein kinase
MAIESPQTFDKYIALGNLGKGAKSTIWKVQDPSTGQLYTLKRVVKESKNDDRFFEQAITEYEVSSRLVHPYLRKSIELKKIRKWGCLGTQELLLVMEYVEGANLMQMGASAIENTIDLFIKVAKGLASLHDLGYVHADIKPKNILVIPNDGIKIIDFGQSCPIGHRKKRIQGTPDYMAPEQKDRGFLDQRTDIFNFGATLYWVLTGQKYPTTMAHSGGNGSEAIAVVSAGPKDVPRPDEVNPEVPSSLSKLTLDCCNHLQKDRPENMREVIARLEVAKKLYLKQKPATPPPPVVEEVKKPQPQPESLNSSLPDDDSDDFEKFIESIL